MADMQKSGTVYQTSEEALAAYENHLKTAGKTADWAAAKNKLLSASLKVLSTVGWMVVATIATEVISAGIQKISDFMNAAEVAAKRSSDALDAFKSTLDEVNNKGKSLDEIANKYKTLSSGVDKLGNNIALTTTEFSEYNSVVNAIADMFPELIQGYTQEGNAILSLEGNVEELRDAYKNARYEAYQSLILFGKDENGNGIVDNAQQVFNGNKDLFGNKWGRSIVEKNDALSELS